MDEIFTSRVHSQSSSERIAQKTTNRKVDTVTLFAVSVLLILTDYTDRSAHCESKGFTKPLTFQIQIYVLYVASTLFSTFQLHVWSRGIKRLTFSSSSIF